MSISLRRNPSSTGTIARTAAVLLACCVGVTLAAQSSSPGYPPPPPNTSGSSRVGASAPDLHPLSQFPSFDTNVSHRQLVARREEMKRRMAENAARLLMLTHDLQAELQDREANQADAKRLDEIAKLARAVRDQMRQ